MTSKITVEPLSIRLRGFVIEELFSKEFVAVLHEEMPTSVIGHFGVAFQGDTAFVEVSHSKDGLIIDLNYVDVEGNDPKYNQGVARVIERVLDAPKPE